MSCRTYTEHFSLFTHVEPSSGWLLKWLPLSLERCLCLLVFLELFWNAYLYLVLNVEVQLYLNEAQSQNKRSLLTFWKGCLVRGETCELQNVVVLTWDTEKAKAVLAHWTAARNRTKREEEKHKRGRAWVDNWAVFPLDSFAKHVRPPLCLSLILWLSTTVGKCLTRFLSSSGCLYAWQAEQS